MMNAERKILSILIQSLLLLTPLISVAQTPLEMEEIKITATRNAEPSGTQSRNITVIDKTELDERQATSVPQTVAHLPNVTLSGGPREDVQNVNIRGLGDNQVLQLVDGVRQNFMSGHRPTYFLDPELIKSVEVVKGPSSALWGSGALGGVISQNTIHAADLLGVRDFGGFIKQGYHSNSDKWLTTTALAGRMDSVDWLLSGFYRDGNEIELGNGENLEGSASRDKGVMAKVDWFIDDAQTATFNLRSSEVNGEVPSNGAADLSSSNFMIHRENQTDHASVDYRLNPDSDWLNAQLMLYWNNTDMQEYRLSDRRADNTEIETLGLNLNNRTELSNISFIYGVDGYQDKLSSNRGGLDRPTPPDATTEVWGAFTEVHIPFAEAWRLEMGGRYDDFSTKAKNLNNDRSDNALSPSVALVWQTTDQLNLTLRYDEAFRAPTAEELYTTGTHFCITSTSCNTFIPNADLKPEESQNIEFIADFNTQNLFTPQDYFGINAALFYNNIDNFIEQTVDSPVFSSLPFPPFFSVDAGNTTYNNVDEAQLKGFELKFNYGLNDFNAALSYGQTRGEDKQTGEKLSGIPADKWVLDLSQRFINRSVKTGLKVSHIETQNRTPSEDSRDYDHYTLTDIYATWQPAAISDLKLDISVNNLFDQYYRVAFQELYMPGRDVRLAVRYQF
ncbi:MULTISPECIES: TonB-dependent hemoglobin/transferrin/lactoferrin family receptor [unclassified Methylophaga]|jgi:hemoglobin/transferrin/lactoferrin receptor protein|uniref:TonB-dependent hemoglobin/transferrin/lactoferrin family receptor n=5 Tax=Methylophaga TaxID=40222 RepID=UPI000C60A632|nr:MULTISPECIES: TonB-dependent hemoglobin/transferrin/lactoferrin family receptor [unclassified Methylophaga]MAL48510.1 TonB-dependent receptor [Methylophaga sp.]MBP25427.1 TonB-dependent receptor [Methylophaga sp.]|tara:strand:+ start:2899 stop:4923 length:2025 start_codon:yes stop_codon:yes gene_type:complete